MSADLTRRIETVRNGRLEPLVSRSPLLSSDATWQGITLEKHLADAEYIRESFDNHSHLLHILTGVPVRHEWRAGGRNYYVDSMAGSVMVIPRGLHASVRCWRSHPEVQWILEFDHSRVEQRVHELLGLKQFELKPQFDLYDPQVSRLIQALQADLETGCLAGSLFGEMIGEAIIVYLAQQYSPAVSSKQPLTGGLSKLRLRRVLEYIQANLQHDIHLDKLAAAAGLSSFHFAKLFKQSTGVTPHRYVLQRRLERAKELLRNPEISLTEASLQSGFSDQSHLTNVFRRFVGVTPSRFRALL